MVIFDVFTTLKIYISLLFSFITFLYLIIILFLWYLKIVATFFQATAIFRTKNETKSSGNLFGANSNRLDYVLSYILIFIFIYLKKRKIGK